MPSILLTRPYDSSRQLALELAGRGYEGVIEPLLTIQPSLTPPPDLAGLQAVMITSANALDCLDRKRAEEAGLLRLPCFCVGSRTAAAAEAFGFGSVQGESGDGLRLAEHIGRSLAVESGALLHICGRHADSRGREALQRFGFGMRSWEVYEAEASLALSPLAIRLFREGKFDAVLLYSMRTAEILKALVIKHGLEACCRSVIALGISDAVRSALAPLSWRRLDAALQPTEDAVLQRLQELLPVSEVS
jgi:uroporphyrinogen-III synthase